MLRTPGNRLLFDLLERPLLPHSHRRTSKPSLLHVSDIPSDYYRFVYRLIEKLEPAYLVHTGDLAEEVKLELDRSRLQELEQELEAEPAREPAQERPCDSR